MARPARLANRARNQPPTMLPVESEEAWPLIANCSWPDCVGVMRAPIEWNHGLIPRVLPFLTGGIRGLTMSR